MYNSKPFLSSFPPEICILMYALSISTCSCHKILVTKVCLCPSKGLLQLYFYLILSQAHEGLDVKGACFIEVKEFMQNYTENICKVRALNQGFGFEKSCSFQVLASTKEPQRSSS